MFLVLEGLDGAGTTTQSARLLTWLRAEGRVVRATREPSEGPVGRLLRATLRREEGSPEIESLPWLFAADRADHLARVVEPALGEGAWVISDRYLHSSLAYQSLHQPMDEVWALNRTFRAPDLTVFLRVGVETCLQRIGGRGAAREIYEERARLERVETAYAHALALVAARGDRIVEIDGEVSSDDVWAGVRAAVAPLLVVG